MSTLPRGIAPRTLIAQIRNTAPYWESSQSTTPALQILKRAISKIEAQNPTLPPDASHELFTHTEYFELCLCAHFLTVATFVPTDVDMQIRLKLWSNALTAEESHAMAEIVLNSQLWDARAVSARTVMGKSSTRPLSGHDGEWFSTAVAAYAANRRKNPEISEQVFEEICSEVEREKALCLEFYGAKQGIELLKTATVIAHNLGDLDRVIDLWNLHPEDALRKEVYKLGHTPDHPRWGNALYWAGELNKQAMAVENHRHFILRSVRCLRPNPDLLLPIAPFLDDWGRTLAKHPDLTPEHKGEIADALIDGWERLKDPVGYTRALAGLLEHIPGGLSELSRLIPARSARALKSGVLRGLCTISRQTFESRWAQIPFGPRMQGSPVDSTQRVRNFQSTRKTPTDLFDLFTNEERKKARISEDFDRTPDDFNAYTPEI